jgi:hypothetical protein
MKIEFLLGRERIIEHGPVSYHAGLRIALGVGVDAQKLVVPCLALTEIDADSSPINAQKSVLGV